MINPFAMFKPKRDLEFVDTGRRTYHNFSVERARDIKPLTHNAQIDKFGAHLMPRCPGIMDYSQFGYIIPAWIDIHIMANKAGVSWYIGDKGPRGDRGFAPGTPMDPTFVHGASAYEVEDGIPPQAIIFPSPWKIFANKNISAILAPAYYHSKHLDDLHVFPGIVDYSKFHAANFICMPRRECHVHIKAGEPLLHVLPFLNKNISATVGPATDEQVDKTNNLIPGDDKQYYRKFMSVKKIFKLESNS